ncbi:MAG: folylpolyglutamate synthase/dihydrofolate synthase family protein [Pseudomonadota bacterium]
MSHQTSDAILDRMMALHPKIIDLTLDRVWRLLDRLGNPQDQLPPVIHIAGTNGKGSTQAMIRAGLEQAGLRVHAYTSPHLVRFHERIRLAGDLISEEALTAVLDECYDANGGEPITYFEITTVAAILAFARTPADAVLLEVGLGGRLDATNVIAQPRLTIVTPVDLDHQQFLGDTLPEIAGEKAGIIKRGVPCIVARQQEAALDVIEATAERVGAPLMTRGQHWHVAEEHGRLVFQDETGLLDLPLPNLPGPHQIENAGTVLAALRALGHGEEACEAAITRAEWPARMQRLTRGPMIDAAPGCEFWLDGGHNPAAGASIAGTLARYPARPTYVICGMLQTKDVTGFIAQIAAHATAFYGVTIPGVTATLSGEETRDAALSLGIDAYAVASAQEAVETIAQRDPNARILICGSLYFAGNVLQDHG